MGVYGDGGAWQYIMNQQRNGCQKVSNYPLYWHPESSDNDGKASFANYSGK